VREELLARFGGQVDMEVLSDSVWGPAAVAADRPPDLTFANR
jgi:hypothetical protein